MTWKLEEWEPTIEKIVVDLNQAAKRGGKRKVLSGWRSQLEKKPTLLLPFQIDAIVREVQRRLESNDP